MAFNPEEYLKTKPLDKTMVNEAMGFNPDAYLGSKNQNQAQGPFVGGEKPMPIPQEQPREALDYAKALYEVPATVVSGIAAPFLGVGKGIIQNIQQGTNERVDRPELAREFTYEPTSPVSQDVLGSVGKAFDAAKIPAYMPALGTTARATQQVSKINPLPSFAAATVEKAKPAVNRLADALREQERSVFSGVGAAEVPQANQRVQLAQGLRVPVKLSKGQATRDLGQQQFEIETAKNFPDTVGKQLIQAQAERNDNILKNFDEFVDATGKQTYGLTATGKIVDKALVDSSNKAKQAVRQAYKNARESGAMQEPIQYGELKSYLDKQTPTVKAKLAPILDAVDEQIKANDPQGSGVMPINQLEDIYSFINKHYEPNTPAAVHAVEMKKIINQATEGKGGDLYQEAKKMRQQYAKTFENAGAVDKLLRYKPNTTDRAVALEDVFAHSILKGSKDDVQNIGLVLKKAGPDGQQAWKELQGQTIQHIKDQVTKSIDTDVYGNPVVSPAKFKAIVTELDQDGKLDYVFGKKGAQEVRDLLDTTILINAPVKGAANYSNSSSAIIRGLDAISTLPLPKVIGAETLSKAIKTKELKKQVKESIEFPDQINKGAK